METYEKEKITKNSERELLETCEKLPPGSRVFLGLVVKMIKKLQKSGKI